MIRFETNTYEFSHGRKPRGKGHWLFSIDESEELLGARGCLSLTEAKTWMRHYCKNAGIDFATIKVCP